MSTSSQMNAPSELNQNQNPTMSNVALAEDIEKIPEAMKILSFEENKKRELKTKPTLSLAEAKAVLGHEGKSKIPISKQELIDQALKTGDFSQLECEAMNEYTRSEDLEKQAQGDIVMTPTMQAMHQGDESLKNLAKLAAKEESKPKTRLAEPAENAAPRYLEGNMPDPFRLQQTPLERTLGVPLTIVSSISGFTYRAACQCCRYFWKVLDTHDIKEMQGYVPLKRQAKHSNKTFEINSPTLIVNIFDNQLDAQHQMKPEQRLDALIDLFQKSRFYSSNRKKGPSSIWPDDVFVAWNDFLSNCINGGAHELIERVERREKEYLEKHQYNRCIEIHQSCHDLNVTCAVPMGIYCPLCPRNPRRLSKTSLAFGQLPERVQGLAKSLDFERLNPQYVREVEAHAKNWQSNKNDNDVIPKQTPYGEADGDCPMEADYDASHNPGQYQEHLPSNVPLAPTSRSYSENQASGHEMSERKRYEMEQNAPRASPQYTSAPQQSRSREGERVGRHAYSQSSCEGCRLLSPKIDRLQELVTRHDRTIGSLVRRLDQLQHELDEKELDSYRSGHRYYDDYDHHRKRSKSGNSSGDLHRM